MDRVHRGHACRVARGHKTGPKVKLRAKDIVPRLRAGEMLTDIAADMKCTPQGLRVALKREGFP